MQFIFHTEKKHTPKTDEMAIKSVDPHIANDGRSTMRFIWFSEFVNSVAKVWLLELTFTKREFAAERKNREQNNQQKNTRRKIWTQSRIRAKIKFQYIQCQWSVSLRSRWDCYQMSLVDVVTKRFHSIFVAIKCGKGEKGGGVGFVDASMKIKILSRCEAVSLSPFAIGSASPAPRQTHGMETIIIGTRRIFVDIYWGRPEERHKKWMTNTAAHKNIVPLAIVGGKQSTLRSTNSIKIRWKSLQWHLYVSRGVK